MRYFRGTFQFPKVLSFPLYSFQPWGSHNDRRWPKQENPEIVAVPFDRVMSLSSAAVVADKHAKPQKTC